MISNILPTVLHRFSVGEATGLEAARATAVKTFGARDLVLRDHGDPLRATGSLYRLDHLDLCYTMATAAISVSFAPSPLVRQQFVLTGTGRMRAGTSHYPISRNETGVVPAGVDFGYDLDRNLSQMVVRIDATALQAKLATLIGRPVGQNFDFAPSATFDDPHQARLRRLIEFFVREVDGEDEIPPLTRAAFGQSIIVNFLYANRHRFSHLLAAEPSAAATWQVSRAAEYIRANRDQMILLEALSEATGASARSLAATFRKAYGISPTQFLERMRLENARSILLQADATTTVAAVAAHCGFHNMNRFSRSYQEIFKELPSATLAAVRSPHGQMLQTGA